jgi:hypothetical protein
MNYPLSPLARRLVLGGAVLGALVVAMGQYAPGSDVGMPAAHAAAPLLLAQADAASAAKDAKGAASAASAAAQDAAKSATEAAAKDEAANGEDSPTVTIDGHGIRVEEGAGKKKRRVHVGVAGVDREYDSFEQFVHEDRGLAAMVVAIVFVVFLTPVLITGLLIWYKLRKNRMLNETMVKLAEKGVVPPADALQALHNGQTVVAANAMAARAPLMEMAKSLRSRAAWSDLRRGVILIAVGLSFAAYSLLDDRSPNWVGLVLLFLGIGYTFLWYFEDRQLAETVAAAPPPTPPAGGA